MQHKITGTVWLLHDLDEHTCGWSFILKTRIFLATEDAEIESCFDALLVLRPHLKRDEFLSQVRRQEEQGYSILALSNGERIASAAGFRIADFLAWGRVLYIDDLTTLPEARKQGFAGLLLDWLIKHARERECNAVHLDTGYARHAAHRVYLNKGFELTSHHMSLCISKP